MDKCHITDEVVNNDPADAEDAVFNSYMVSIPVTGILVVYVDAENVEQATEMAMSREKTSDMIEELDVHEKIVEGNVFYGQLNEIEVEENE